jgi:hypothetical protein
MNRVECILDGNALQVACGHFHSQREHKVNLLDRRVGQELLENVLFVYACRRSIDLPEQEG